MPRFLIHASLALATLPSAARAADPCADWEVMAIPNPPTASHVVTRDIVAISPTDVWAVGTYFDTDIKAFAMHFDGKDWTAFEVPHTSDYGNNGLWAVGASGPNDVWAAGFREYTPPGIPFAGFGMHLFVVRWNGSQWTMMNTPHLGGGSGDQILHMEVMGPDSVWFFGDGHPVPVSPQPALAMHWNGSSFTVVSLPQVNAQVSGYGNGNGLIGASALGPNDIWAVGAAGDGDELSCQKSQILHWNGSQWQHVPAGPLNCWMHSLNAVVAIGANDVWVGGDYQDASGYHGLALHWNGSTWTQVPIPGTVNEFAAFAPDDVYAAGGGIFHWNGSTWSVVETFPQVVGATQAGLSKVGIGAGGRPCELWTAGRQLIGNQVMNFAARAVPALRAGDTNADGMINVNDLLAVINQWGACPAMPQSCPADVAPSPLGDRIVNVNDLLMVINNWG